MHLLVLSAFRQDEESPSDPQAHVSMHLLVLSAFRPISPAQKAKASKSQCTFWCSVLSDQSSSTQVTPTHSVSMHLLVLSAFRPHRHRWHDPTSQEVSMHLLVLSAFRQEGPSGCGCGVASQCTFWCSVLSDGVGGRGKRAADCVSMHLLVLSAFRPSSSRSTRLTLTSLNAPFGAQCFPT